LRNTGQLGDWKIGNNSRKQLKVLKVHSSIRKSKKYQIGKEDLGNS